MNKDFEQLIALYGISKDEGKQLFNTYKDIDNVKRAIETNTIDFLKKSDVDKLKKYFNISDKKLKVCNSCKLPLPSTLDRGICPQCSVRN